MLPTPTIAIAHMSHATAQQRRLRNHCTERHTVSLCTRSAGSAASREAYPSEPARVSHTRRSRAVLVPRDKDKAIVLAFATENVASARQCASALNCTDTCNKSFLSFLPFPSFLFPPFLFSSFPSFRQVHWPHSGTTGLPPWRDLWLVLRQDCR